MRDGAVVLGRTAGDEPLAGAPPVEADLPPSERVRDLASEMLVSVSTARAGSSAPELLDGSDATFWQSDGAAPHSLNVQFYKRQSVAEVALHLNYEADESYTPSELVLRAGNSLAELRDVVRLTLEQPVGWVRIPLIERDGRGLQRYLRTLVLQLSVVACHQNGRDCHIRQLRVFAPLEGAGSSTASGSGSGAPLPASSVAGAAAATRSGGTAARPREPDGSGLWDGIR